MLVRGLHRITDMLTDGQHPRIPGYTYGEATTARSPLSLNDLQRLEQTATLSQQDQHYLAMAGDVLESQAEELVNTWRNVIAEQPHLARAFASEDGAIDEAYKTAVKRRFVRWVIDTCRRPRDQDWLDYQEEIAAASVRRRKKMQPTMGTPRRLCHCVTCSRLAR